MIKLLQYQIDWINDDSKKSIFEKSRQIGVSWAEAAWSVLRRVKHDINHYVICQRQIAANRFIVDCRFWIKEFGIDKLFPITYTNSVITFQKPSGDVTISAFPSNPDAVRGYNGDITLDEYAWQEDNAYALYEAAEPATMRRGKLRIISTHNGPNTLFNSLIVDSRLKQNDFNIHSCDIFKAVKQGLAEQIVKQDTSNPLNIYLENKNKLSVEFIDYIKKSCGSSLVWQQEYCCKVSDVENQIVSTSNYKNCVVDQEPIEETIPDNITNPIYIGIDIGIKALTVIWCIEQVYDSIDDEYVYKTRAIQQLKGYSIPDQIAVIKPYLDHPGVVSCQIDMGSIGRGISDELVRLYGDMVVPVAIGKPKKTKLCEVVRKYVEQQRVSLPNDQLIEGDICSMRLNYLPNGVVKYSGGTSYSHADFFMALGLALLAAEGANNIILV